MRYLVERVLAHIGFDMGLFNVELRHDPSTDEVMIVEINPRMCAQWADLMERVNGTNTYEVLLSLAVGDDPAAVLAVGSDQVATSFILRRFEDAIVAEAPDDRTLERIRASPRVTSVSTFYSAGDRLSDNWFQDDGLSYRFAVVNVAGQDVASLDDEFRRVVPSSTFSSLDCRVRSLPLWSATSLISWTARGVRSAPGRRCSPVEKRIQLEAHVSP